MKDADLAPLLARMREGDEEAVRLLFDRARGPLFQFFYRLCRNADLSDDLLQNTFFNLWRYRRNYRGEGVARSYVYRVAINSWHALAAQEARTRTTHERAALERKEDHAEDGTSAGLEAEELKRQVWKSISELPEPQRETLVLHRFQGLSCREIAASQNQPLKTVESRLRLALLKLTTKLKLIKDLP